ncbi:ammonia-dependent NAD(+) synthetase [Kocuria sp. CH-021]|uniref:ammonia-dependent NAD(+) synthetase n=1 Tax=Kocuria sp. CH-021 TaxID=3406735 RepID=UPI003C72148A
MRTLQAAIIEEMGVKPEIDPQQEIEARVGFLCDYLRASGTNGFVLGISGGLDSTLAGRLAQMAVDRLAEEGVEADFVAVRLPYNVQHDEDDAQAALEFIRPSSTVTYNVAPAVDGFEAEFREATGREISDFNKGNIKARVRMTAQYAIAGERNLLVIGTDHGAESVTGFFTKYGDGGADVLPLFGLDKRQNRLLTKTLGAQERLWAKAPTADLLDDAPGQTDEAELGLSYDDIDDYLEGHEVDAAVAEKIEHRWRITRHKRTTPATLLDDWWRA